MAAPPKALFFDVFGTLVDWRTSIAREAEIALRPLGHSLDWLAFADAWRDEYQPAMEAVRSSRMAFCKLDLLISRAETAFPGMRSWARRSRATTSPSRASISAPARHSIFRPATA